MKIMINGEIVEMPDVEEEEEIYPRPVEEQIAELSEELQAAKIILGVE